MVSSPTTVPCNSAIGSIELVPLCLVSLSTKSPRAHPGSVLLGAEEDLVSASPKECLKPLQKKYLFSCVHPAGTF